ncbi:MAG: ChaN family lipoprotein [Myxococcota bacterium]
MLREVALAAVCVALSACATGPSAPSTKSPAAQVQASARSWSYRVFTPQAEVDLNAAIAAAAQADYVLFGETHLDDQTHRLENAVLEGLIAARGAERTVLTMEMFKRDQQAGLDGYIAGSLTEAQFLEQAPPWPNYRTGYRPLVETAKQHGVPVVGANLPTSLQRRFAMKKGAAAESLTEAERAWFPETIHPPAETYWARVEQRLRDAGHGHMGGMDEDARRWAIQNLWDNTMADAMVRARANAPESTVLHVVGAFHAEYGDGIAAQLRHRDPDASIVIISVAPVDDLRGLGPEDATDRADFMIYALADASGLNSGTLGVSVPGELRYRLAAPAVGQPSGLLVWLGDDETAPRDALTRWNVALGDDVMVAVLEHPHRVRTGDLRTAGRWTWPDSFANDAFRASQAIDRMVAYLSDRWSVPTDRIVVAGEGAGADVALWHGLYGNAGAHVVALEPNTPDRIAEAGIPRDPSTREVFVRGAGLDDAKTTFDVAGVPFSLETEPDGEALVRRALGLETRTLSGATDVHVGVDSPIARQWTALHARLDERDGTRRVQKTGKDATYVPDPAFFSEGEGLPLAPGAFGGTTILVLPRTMATSTKAAWRALGEQDVLKKRSRFHTLVVTDDDGLGPLLDELKAKGKRSMLILPAAFVVDEERMEQIQARTQGHDEGLRLHYAPGLGGSWAKARAAQ